MVKQNGEEEKQQQQHTFLMVLLAKGKREHFQVTIDGIKSKGNCFKSALFHTTGLVKLLKWMKPLVHNPPMGL